MHLPSNRYTFQELITGGDLFSYIESKDARYLEETEAAVIVRQLLKAIDYLHDNSVTHRDLKPDNILMTSWTCSGRVVITDFGHATRATVAAINPRSENQQRRRMYTQCGTWEYTAP